VKGKAMEAIPFAREADVLVVEGGFVGAWAGLLAAQLGASVILVDKAYVCRSRGVEHVGWHHYLSPRQR
jgi:succinate dehydrogenase/fumarate reductase flavoprotein subunit